VYINTDLLLDLSEHNMVAVNNTLELYKNFVH